MRSHICNQFVTICCPKFTSDCSGEQSKPLLNFVAHSTKRFKLLLHRSICRIIETPVDWLCAWKDRAVLFGSVANGDHVIKLLLQELFYVFRYLPALIDADFFHHFNVGQGDAKERTADLRNNIGWDFPPRQTTLGCI